MDLQKVNPVDAKGWDERVLRLSSPCFFYSASWARVLRDSYGYEPIYFIAEENGELAFMLPTMSIKSRLTGSRAVSLPFTDHCMPYVQRRDRFSEWFDDIVQMGKVLGWHSIEIRGGSDFFKQASPSLRYYFHVLKLTGENSCLKKIERNVNRNVRNSVKRGVQVAREYSADAMNEFYRLNCITRRKHGLPPQPRLFFKNLYEYVIRKKTGAIFIARWNGTPIAASVFLRIGNQAMYKYGASDPAYLRLRANNLVMWEAIQYYAANGCDALDLGKTEEHNEGLRSYKLRWGADEQPLNYYRYSLRSDRFEIDHAKETGWYTVVFSKMPMPVLKLMGGLAYKHIG